MEKLILILLTYTLVISCNKENTDDKEDTLIGKWQYIEFCEGGTPNGFVCNPIDNGYFYQFKEDGTFYTNQIENTGCIFGTFLIQDSKLYMEYNVECELELGILVQNYIFENRDLILSPIAGTCPEGCSSRFKRVSIDK